MEQAGNADRTGGKEADGTGLRIITFNVNGTIDGNDFY